MSAPASRPGTSDADGSGVWRLQLLVVAVLWLLVAVSAVRTRMRRLEDRHWLAALETLRRWDTSG